MSIWEPIFEGIMAIKTVIAAVFVSTVALLHPTPAHATFFPQDGMVTLYGTGGVIAAQYKPREFIAQVTSDTSGNFTVDMTIAGFTIAPPDTQCSAVSTGTGNQAAFFTTMTSITATTITGRVLTPAMVVVGGNAMATATSAVTVKCRAEGW